MTECKQSYSAIFPNSRANNSGCSGSIWPIIELIQDLMGIYIVAKFGTDWSIFCRCKGVNKVKYSKFSNSRADNSDSSGPITSTVILIRDLMVIYILTKFGADWLIFVDARVLTRKLWIDIGRTSGAFCGNGLNLNQTILCQNAALCCNVLITESIISMIKG